MTQHSLFRHPSALCTPVGDPVKHEIRQDLLCAKVEQAPCYKLKQKTSKTSRQKKKKRERENWTHHHFLLDPNSLGMPQGWQLFCRYPGVIGSSRIMVLPRSSQTEFLHWIFWVFFFFPKQFYPTRSLWLSCSCNRMTNNGVTCCEKFRKWEMLSHFPNRAETTLIPLGKMEQTIKLGMLLILKLTRELTPFFFFFKCNDCGRDSFKTKQTHWFSLLKSKHLPHTKYKKCYLLPPPFLLGLQQFLAPLWATGLWKSPRKDSAG